MTNPAKPPPPTRRGPKASRTKAASGGAGGAAVAEKAAAEKAARRFGRIATAWRPPRDHDADIAAAPGEHDEGRSEEEQAAGIGAASPETAGEANGEGERRRRRRGRRGGRRNRRDREGEGSAAEHGGTIEPELTHAVADLDGAPPEASVVHVPITENDVRSYADAGPREEQPQSVAAPAIPEALAAEPPAEPPRRRSTVREPAPTALGGEGTGVAPSFTPPAPSAEPVVSSPAESESDDRPRRSGWWSKRALGKG